MAAHQPDYWERLCGVSGPTQLRPAHWARASWACWGRSLSCQPPRGWHPANSERCTGCCAGRGVSACSGGSAECVGHLRRAPGGAERENRIPEPATEPPPAGFGPGGARGVLGATEIVVQDLYRLYPSLTPSNTLLGRVMCRSTILVRALSACPDCPRGEACSDQVEALWSRRGPCRLKPRVPPTQCE